MTIAQVNPKDLKTNKQAYIFWCCGLVGLCGLHRFYTKHYLSGTLYLITFGFYGVGQFIDLFYVGKMVDEFNTKLGLRTIAGYQVPPAVQQQVVVNIGEQIASILPSGVSAAASGNSAAPQTSNNTQSPEERIMNRCHDDEASMGQLCLASGLAPLEAKKIVNDLEGHGIIVARVDENGTIKYKLA